MNGIFFVLIIVLLSCSNHSVNSETNAISKDLIHSKAGDSISATFVKESKGEPGFLTQYFNDTAGVRKIRKYVSEIDKHKLKDSIELENEEFMNNLTDGGGSLTGYFQKGELVKIKEWYGLSWGILQVNFYFKNDILLFVNETEDHFYIDSNGTDHSRSDLIFRGQYYFNKSKLFDEVSVGHNRFERDDQNPETEYLKRAADNATIIFRKRKG